MVSVPVFDGSGEVVGVVQFGRSLRTELEAVDRLVLVLIPIGTVSLLLTGVSGLFISRRAVRPVRDAFERQRAFIADASHELKTPLSLARVAGEVLARSRASPKPPMRRRSGPGSSQRSTARAPSSRIS